MSRPFAGELVPAAHYRSGPRVMVLMIEVNRGLYMNEQSSDRRADFAAIQTRVQDAVRSVIAECRRELHIPQLR
jgi:N-formylglutamate amidohydrolase